MNSTSALDVDAFRRITTCLRPSLAPIATHARRRIHATVHALVALSVVGCAAPAPNYNEPDPKTEKVARLRISVPIGMWAQVKLHPNTDEGSCLRYDNVQILPVDFNTSGFPSSKGERTIGMKGGEKPFATVNSEMYLPTASDITISASYSATGAVVTTSCRQAFRFRAEPGKDYEMSMLTGEKLPARSSCQMDMRELKVSSDDAELTSLSIPVTLTPVIVQSSRAWKQLCKGRS